MGSEGGAMASLGGPQGGDHPPRDAGAPDLPGDPSPEGVAVDRDESDPLAGDPRVAAYFGEAFPVVEAFAELLRDQGVLRGLIGPRELPRLWERHLLNSAAISQFLPTTGRVIDVGSGAGLPGVVLAAMLPDAEVVLLEPMERRTLWLAEVVAALGLENVVIERGRADEFHGDLDADAVTARAVAPLEKLARWCMPLLRKGGSLVAMKGQSAAEELETAKYVIRKLGGGPGEVLLASTIDGVDSTTVIKVIRQTVR